ncbi:hypothetical protein D8674_011106 [Pyrus ussuriensis x Pyrus communis]|uniref:Uncharacterized protein n=1 Tax=Pyrus ussuriensis x Pyrus communis TaxID=2448454 RepID=A0A5N5FXS0_9ROSA|nr:hypothetical protein D8674_011106 [Pyrus ussuriensis x Pyrus communis]
MLFLLKTCHKFKARRDLESKTEDVYVRPGNEIAEQLHATMVEKGDDVLQEATSQLPSETPMEDVTLPEDVGFQIMTEVLDQKYGRRHGKVVRGMGKARVRETGASFSKSTTGEVNALKEEVTTLKGQLAAQDEQIKAQSEQMRAQSEHIKAENEQMRAENEQMRAQMSMIVQALAVSGLQIQLPAPDLTPPSTSQPPHLPDTQ